MKSILTHTIFKASLFLLGVILSTHLLAESPDSVSADEVNAKAPQKASQIYNYKFRPNISAGFLNDKFVYSYGARFLLSSEQGSTRFYGLDFTVFDGIGDGLDAYFTGGIMLETKPAHKWFVAGIGTVGYFNFKGENSPALSTNLGWEPNMSSRFMPFATVRSDFIFASEFTILNTLNVGLGLLF